ncbi:MAG: PHA/PHB synthase family protein [Janthinobacterium lividum]
MTQDNAEDPKPSAPGPMGLWQSWMETAMAAVPAGALPPVFPAADGTAGAGAWPGGLGLDAAGAGVAQALEAMQQQMAADPTLRAVDAMWNANPLREVVPVDWAEIARALRTVWLLGLRRPERMVEQAARLNAQVWQGGLEMWAEAARLWGGAGTPAAEAPGAGAARGDRRFAAPEWQSPVFRQIKDSYLMASEWLLEQPADAELPAAERARLTFHLRQFVDAMSPALVLGSNPVALKRAVETGGASLADGVRNLLADLKEGRLSMVDADAFAPGRNLAVTPGKVVMRNRLVELIQYAPSTPEVHEVPLLILPPWINKFYVMDLQPRNSMVAWLVAQGFTVFMVSWRNPDASLDAMAFEDYMRLGPLAASDAIREITGSGQVNVMGYCIGGTLLTLTLAWLAKRRDERFASASLMVSMQDFAEVGETAMFLGEPAIDFIEQQMLDRGYLDSREMSNMFNLLRSNDLIWANVVNNYLMGNKPPAFDLLYWNSDGTRMARTAHSWYLRNTYVENNLVRPGTVVLDGEAIDLGDIVLDLYSVGAEKDHIVPWQSAWRVTQLVGGTVRFVLASSGHVAGIINPPGGKGTYRAADVAPGTATDPQAWREAAGEHRDSWWVDWAAWLAARGGARGTPPGMGSEANPAVMDAPGSYVLEK